MAALRGRWPFHNRSLCERSSCYQAPSAVTRRSIRDHVTAINSSQRKLAWRGTTSSDRDKILALVTQSLEIMKDSKAPRSSRSPRPTFAEVAALIAPSNSAPWLPAFLECWAQGIRHDMLADECRPKTFETVIRLSRVADAVVILRRELDDPNIRNLIEFSRTPKRIPISIGELSDLSNRTEAALSSPALIGKDGKTKRGPGKPIVPDVFDAKSLCAARILELGRFLNKFEPGSKSRRAGEAAQAYWLASGGRSEGFGDPVNGWKRYFKIAKDNAGSIGLKRLIWWRDLQQCARRGRPPWYIGNYFPVEEA
jgi:hypothetical protein